MFTWTPSLGTATNPINAIVHATGLFLGNDGNNPKAYGFSLRCVYP